MQQQHNTIRKAARAAFSESDWAILMREPWASSSFANLCSTEEVEEFIYSGYERLRLLRESASEMPSLGGAFCVPAH